MSATQLPVTVLVMVLTGLTLPVLLSMRDDIPVLTFTVLAIAALAVLIGHPLVADDRSPYPSRRDVEDAR